MKSYIKLLIAVAILVLSLLLRFIVTRFVPDNGFLGICLITVGNFFCLYVFWKILVVDDHIKNTTFNTGNFILISLAIHFISMAPMFLKGLGSQPIQINQYLFDKYFFLFILKSIIIAPIFEEILYRKLILGQVLSRIKPILAILITSLIFTFVHLQYFFPIFQYFSVVGIFIISVLISIVYLKTKNIKLAVFIHAFGNLIGYFNANYLQLTKNESFTFRLFIFCSIVLVFGVMYKIILKWMPQAQKLKSIQQL